KTFEAIRGAKRAIVHLYNSTSELQRRVVFGLDKPGIIDIAVTGARQIRDLAAKMPETEIIYQYSPESFSGTELDFAVEICEVVRTSEYCTQLPVHPRHPYAGELVFTAFSGSHQDAIKKGFEALEKRNDELWEVPYLPIDPKDLGRSYEAVIRVNSQSGKGGVAYVLKSDHGLDLPRGLQIEFSRVVQQVADRTGKEASSPDIWTLFEDTYLGRHGIKLKDYSLLPEPRAGERRIAATVEIDGRERQIEGVGNGPIAAFVNALQRECGVSLTVLDYHEDAVSAGADAQAAAYVQIRSSN